MRHGGWNNCRSRHGRFHSSGMQYSGNPSLHSLLCTVDITRILTLFFFSKCVASCGAEFTMSLNGPFGSGLTTEEEYRVYEQRHLAAAHQKAKDDDMDFDLGLHEVTAAAQVVRLLLPLHLHLLIICCCVYCPLSTVNCSIFPAYHQLPAAAPASVSVAPTASSRVSSLPIASPTGAALQPAASGSGSTSGPKMAYLLRPDLPLGQSKLLSELPDKDPAVKQVVPASPDFIAPSLLAELKVTVLLCRPLISPRK